MASTELDQPSKSAFLALPPSLVTSDEKRSKLAPSRQPLISHTRMTAPGIARVITRTKPHEGNEGDCVEMTALSRDCAVAKSSMGTVVFPTVAVPDRNPRIPPANKPMSAPIGAPIGRPT